MADIGKLEEGKIRLEPEETRGNDEKHMTNTVIQYRNDEGKQDLQMNWEKKELVIEMRKRDRKKHGNDKNCVVEKCE